jgi:hypothetical protein
VRGNTGCPRSISAGQIGRFAPLPRQPIEQPRFRHDRRHRTDGQLPPPPSSFSPHLMGCAAVAGSQSWFTSPRHFLRSIADAELLRLPRKLAFSSAASPAGRRRRRRSCMKSASVVQLQSARRPTGICFLLFGWLRQLRCLKPNNAISDVRRSSVGKSMSEFSRGRSGRRRCDTFK